MSYYAVLGVSTTLLAVISWILWHRTRDVSFPIGLFFIYFWTLHGGWSVVSDHLSGVTTSRYQYLYDKLFEVSLDEDYLIALAYYGLFAVVAATTLMVQTRTPTVTRVETTRKLVISHPVILIIGAAAGAVSYFIIKDSFDAALAFNQSVYATSRDGSVGTLFTIHQVLNRVALMPAVIGMAVALSGADAKFIIAKGNRRYLSGYLLVLGAMYIYCALLGNKNELFAALLAGSLFYLANAHRPRIWLLVAGCVSSIGLISLIDWFRGIPTASLGDVFNLSDAVAALVSIRTSNEAFGSHLSMYGALHFAIPLTFGSSVISLAASVVPRALWPDRPLDIYPYYAGSVHAVEGQGYSIHHATGWYLNFGFVGVVIGAVVLGALWASLFNSFHRRHPSGSLHRFFVILSPWFFVAGIPNLIRSGIEGYKGLAVDSFLIPTLCLFASSVVPGVVGTTLPEPNAPQKLAFARRSWRQCQPIPRHQKRTTADEKRNLDSRKGRLFSGYPKTL
jgi:hypothetical protein